MQRINKKKFTDIGCISPFLKLSGISGKHKYFHRTTGDFKDLKGVYFWGFTFNGNIPSKKEDFIIFYIGKSERNIPERIMQEITQFIIGGFGNIPNIQWLKRNPFNSKLKEIIKNSRRRKNMPYNPDGLHMLKFFKGDKKIQNIVNLMIDSAIFCWIPLEDVKEIRILEKELHHITMTNCFGSGRLININKHLWSIGSNQTQIFNKIIWTENRPLEDWLKEVNSLLFEEIAKS